MTSLGDGADQLDLSLDIINREKLDSRRKILLHFLKEEEDKGKKMQIEAD